MNRVVSKKLAVSVVIPVKNAEKTVKEAVDSILNQTLKNIELILVNDGSTDSTKDILYSYSNSDQRIKVIENTGQGISDALNCGIELAKSLLIARMDADDISHPERLEKQVKEFNDNPKLVLLGTFCHTFKDGINELQEIKVPTTNSELQRSIRSIPTFSHPTVMIKREIIQQVGGYRKKFDGAEDHDLHLRLSRHGEIAILPEFLLWYRLHPAQFSRVKITARIRASVAAVFCDMCVHQNLPDPSEFGKTCDELALDLLFQESLNTKTMSKLRLVLCSRAIQGLAMLPDFHHQLISIRKKILYKLTKTGQFHAAFSLWRRTRKKIG